MDYSTPGFPVLHGLSEFAQIHVHWVCDAIQPSHSLPPPSPFAFNLSQHKGLFQWVDSSYQVAKVLELQFQHQSFQWILRVDFLASRGLSSVFSSTTIQKHQFKIIHISNKNKTKNHLGFLEKNTFLGGFNVIRVASLLLNIRLIIKSRVLMKMFIFLGSSMQNLSAAQLTVVGKFLPFLLAVRFSCRWNSIVLHQNRSCRWKLWKQPWLSS